MKKSNIFFLAALLFLILSIVVFGLHFLSRPEPGSLRTQIKVTPSVMTLAYKVYGNRKIEGGKYWLGKTILYNEGGSSLKNVGVYYRVPAYVDWTTPHLYKEILPGQTVVDLFYPKFPADVLKILNPTPAQLEVKVRYECEEEEEEEINSVDFQFRGRNDMVWTIIPESEIFQTEDVFWNKELAAVFVTPEDPIIKYFTHRLQQKRLGGTLAGVKDDPKVALRFMKALYDFENDIKMVYAGAKGLPEKRGDIITKIQRMRLPREVLVGRSGLCIELAALFCSVCDCAGLDTYIMMTSGHAWPVIIAGGQHIPIECVSIGGEGLWSRGDFQQAIQSGIEDVEIYEKGGNEHIGVSIGKLYINELYTQGICPPELPDDPDLRKKIDEMFEEIPSIAKETPASQELVTYQDSYGRFSVSFPSNWLYGPNPYPQAPWIAFMAGNQQGTALEVYIFDKSVSAEDAIQQIQYITASTGGTMTYNKIGTCTLSGKKFKRFKGISARYGAPAGIEWEVYFCKTQRTTVGLSISAVQGQFLAHEGLFSKILDNFKVAK